MGLAARLHDVLLFWRTLQLRNVQPGRMPPHPPAGLYTDCRSVRVRVESVVIRYSMAAAHVLCLVDVPNPCQTTTTTSTFYFSCLNYASVVHIYIVLTFV